MSHNIEDASKPTLLLRSLELAIHETNRDFDTIIQEDEAKANSEVEIYRSNKDFDALIQEDETGRREEEEIAHETASHHVDVDNLVFPQETEINQDNIIERGNDIVDDQVIDNSYKEIRNRHTSIYIPTANGKIHGEVPHKEIAGPIDPQTIGNAHKMRIYHTFALIVTLMAIKMVCISILRRRRTKRKLGKEVFKYILDFDVEDVDLTQAVTGGWHGTYKNNLRDGVDTDDTDDDDYELYDDKFANDLENSDDDGYDEEAIFEDSCRSQRTSDGMIVFIEEDEEMLVGHKNIYFRQEVADDDIYYASDDDLFSPVRSRKA